MLCNSRSLPFVDGNGEVQTADWGDIIYKNDKGVLLKQMHLYD